MTHSTGSPNLSSRRSILRAITAVGASALVTPYLRADYSPDWTTPMPPHRIMGNLYYVGSRDLASYLIQTSQGLILINSNLTSSPLQIKASVEKLGFHFGDVKLLLISHAHYDHCAGSAQILKETGAKYAVMDADVEDVESGGKTNFHYGTRKDLQYPAAKVDQTLQDQQQIHLGETTLTAHKTAGHTKGCTTWTMTVHEADKSYNAVIVGSPNVLPGYNLIDDPRYPTMAADFTRQFVTLKALPCDLFLGAHGSYYNLLTKYPKLKAGNQSAFLDPAGYKTFVANSQQAFESELAKQKKAHATHSQSS